METPAPKLTVRIGCNIEYSTSATTPILFVVKPRMDRNHFVHEERLSFRPGLQPDEFEDSHGNITFRAMLTPGGNHIDHDALVSVSSLPEARTVRGGAVPVDRLPANLLRYTLPSRYCDSDKLRDFAWDHFARFASGIERVEAICDWVHENVEYRYGSGRPDLSASEVIHRRYGVCRDFAHAGVALCRAFNLPTRYVTGHLPDIGFQDSGSPMDFHAYMEVYLEEGWHTFDARFNVPRIGRIKIAHGQDAVDGAISTIYGAADLVYFQVWAYQVDPREVALGSPVDLSKRMDGTPTVNLP